MYNVYLNTPDGLCLDTIESVFLSTTEDNDMGLTGLLLYPSDGGDTWLVIMSEEDAKLYMGELFSRGQSDLTEYASVYLDEDSKVTYDSRNWIESYRKDTESRSNSILGACRLASYLERST